MLKFVSGMMFLFIGMAIAFALSGSMSDQENFRAFCYGRAIFSMATAVFALILYVFCAWRSARAKADDEFTRQRWAKPNRRTDLNPVVEIDPATTGFSANEFDQLGLSIPDEENDPRRPNRVPPGKAGECRRPRT